MSDEYDPRTFRVEPDKEGFMIINDYGEDMEPKRRWHSYNAAQASLSDMVAEWLENYEPPDPPGWEGGFAENH